jgi:hypothetical protein
VAIPLVYDIFAVDRASRVFDRVSHSMEKNAEESGHLGKAFATVGAIAATTLTAGTLAAGYAMTKFYEAAEQARKTAALTDAVIKSTGGAAGVTASHVDKLASSISTHTGIEDDAIKANENLLLTFTQIQNGVGKGNKIFDEATLAVQNMSVALGEDSKNASIQLGKALNDPIKGATALKRVGVSLTAQQQDQVKKFVESNHAIKAQQLILGELKREFGGAAAAAATPMGKLKASLHQVSEELGKGLLPAVDKAANWLAAKLPGAMRFTEHAFTAVKGAISGVSGRVSGLVHWFTDSLWPALQAVGERLLPRLRASFASISGTIKSNHGTFSALGEMFKLLGHVVAKVVVPALGAIAVVYISEIAPAFKAFMFLLKNVVIPTFVFLARAWLDTVSVLVNGAAKAFGWIPKIGGPLKRAAASFNGFAGNVNASLDSIQRDLFVNIHINTVPGDIAGGINGQNLSPQQAASQNRQGIAAAAAKKATDAAKGSGKAIGLSLAKGLADTAPKVGDAAKKVTSAAQKQLTAFQQAVASLRTSVHDSVLGFFSLQSEGNPFAGLGAMAHKAVRFAHALAKLTSEGVNPAVIAMIAQAGPDVGLRAAVELSTAGKANRSRINNAYSTISNAANRAAGTVAGSATPGSLGIAARSEGHLASIDRAVNRHHKASPLHHGWAAA